MATAGSDPQWPMPSSLQGSSRRGAQSILSRSEEERQSCWSSSPMGQRRKDTFHRASSYLLPQLVHRSVESDADGQDCGDEGEGEVESEESSESEMLNLEVCLPPSPPPLAPFSGRPALLLRRQCPAPRLPPLSSLLTLGLEYFPASPLFLSSTFGFLRVKLHSVLMKQFPPICMGVLHLAFKSASTVW